MLYEEFLTITNLTEDDITVWTYENVVEPMYMAAPDSMDKHDFDVRRVTEVINDDETLMAVLDQMFMFDLTYDDGAWTITECVIL